MFSQTTEYALRAAVWLAERPENPQTTQQISEGMRVPSGYLAKVMQQLVRAGVVHSQRGKGGGFLLTRTPRRLTVLEIINAVEPVRRIRECPLGLARHRKQLCPLHRRLDEIAAATERAFAQTHLSELLEVSEPLTQIAEAAHAH